jgi:uncharacterized protein (TIGR01655 family)
MKKIIPVFILALVIVGGFTWYQVNYGGSDYYAVITTDGEKEVKKTDYGNGTFTYYNYKVTAANKKGNTKELKFNTGGSEKPIKKEAILKFKVNNKKGVLSWESVDKSDIPEKAWKVIK